MKIFSKIKKIKKTDRSLKSYIIGSFVIVIILFALMNTYIGYYAFSATLSKEYSESVYQAANMALKYADSYCLNYYMQEDFELPYDDIEGLRSDSYVWNEDEDLGFYIEYFGDKEELRWLCDELDMSVIYLIVPDSDYENFTCIYNCVNKSNPYEEWGFKTVHPISDEDSKAAYKRIMEGQSEKEILFKTKNLNGAQPHITALVPLKDEEGNVLGIMCAQRFMTELVEAQDNYVIGVGALAVIIVILIVVITSVFLRKQIIEPVKNITEEAKRFARENTYKEDILDANISKASEISELSVSIDKMEKDMVNYIDNITSMTKENERIGAEFSLASSIQLGMLPTIEPDFVDKDEYDVYATMTPAREVGGDFFDIFMLDDKRLALLVADVSDKGMGAAFFMAISKTVIKTRALLGGGPAEILAYADKMISGKNPAGMFVTVLFGIIDLETGHVEACNAGHDYPLVMRQGGDFALKKTPHGSPVAFLPDMEFPQFEFDLKPGERVFIYTDGLIDAKRSDGERFGIERVISTLNRYKDYDNKKLVAAMKDSVKYFAGSEPQFDDMTMLGFTYKGKKNK